MSHRLPSSRFRPSAVLSCLAVLLAMWNAIGNAALVTAPAAVRETVLARSGLPAAVILVPDEQGYRELGKQLATAISARTGLSLAVESAAGYVSGGRGPSRPSGWTGIVFCSVNSGTTPSWSVSTPVISIPPTPCSPARAGGSYARYAIRSISGTTAWS